jgi:hypothetical protein
MWPMYGTYIATLLGLALIKGITTFNSFTCIDSTMHGSARRRLGATRRSARGFRLAYGGRRTPRRAEVAGEGGPGGGCGRGGGEAGTGAAEGMSGALLPVRSSPPVLVLPAWRLLPAGRTAPRLEAPPRRPPVSSSRQRTPPPGASLRDGLLPSSGHP